MAARSKIEVARVGYTMFGFTPQTASAAKWMRGAFDAVWSGDTMLVDQRYARGVADILEQRGLSVVAPGAS
jgi:hypothetical protein